jgi:hypothetical protein
MATKMPRVRFGSRTPTGISRLIVLVLGVALALVVLVPSAPAGAVSDQLPDLGMAHPQDLRIEKTSSGKLLRFSSIVVNVGVGPFEVHGERAEGASNMTTQQRIFDSAGGSRDVSTAAIMYFSGDGHNHWHVRDLEHFELIPLDNGNRPRTGAKHGFCFYDNYRYGSSKPTVYTRASGACGTSSSLQTFMGLSVGWGDRYRYTLPDQYIDISGLTSGQYRLWATADANDWFVESDDSNNFAWVDIKISRTKVSVLRYGPSAQRISG